jgi:small subunit ribosomal protein S16
LTISDYFATIAGMLKIRMQRTGRKHQPTYRLVLSDSKSSAKSGKYLELLGNYDSRHGEKSEIKIDRVSYWISVGAQISPTVHNLLLDKKIITGKKINKLPLKKAIKRPDAEVVETPVASAEVASEPEIIPVEEVVAQ